ASDPSARLTRTMLSESSAVVLRANAWNESPTTGGSPGGSVVAVGRGDGGADLFGVSSEIFPHAPLTSAAFARRKKRKLRELIVFMASDPHPRGGRQQDQGHQNHPEL